MKDKTMMNLGYKILKRLGFMIIKVNPKTDILDPHHSLETLNNYATFDLWLATYLRMKGATINQVVSRRLPNKTIGWKVVLDNVSTKALGTYIGNRAQVNPKAFSIKRMQLKKQCRQLSDRPRVEKGQELNELDQNDDFE